MRKTFKYRLHPTRAQRTNLQTQLDACRKVYNKTLETRRDAWHNEQKDLSRYDTHKLLTLWKMDDELLRDGHAQAMQDAQKRVDLAYRAFFRRVKRGDKPGYPRFKSFDRYDSFTYPQPKGNWRFLDNGRVRLSKIGNVRIKLHRPIEGTIKTLTIRRDSLGNWYACFSCEVEPKPLPLSTEMVGIDLGLTTFATFSTGETIERKRWMKQDEKDLKRIQRKVSALGKGTPERHKAIKALNHVHTRIKNRRNNFAHQESRKLVNRFGLIVFEKLEIQYMQQSDNKVINRGIADVAWGQFVSHTRVKAVDAGRGFVQVNPRGTTQQCSSCGQMVAKDLSVRVHKCTHCGLKIGRDLNAAINILGRGLTAIGNQSVEAPVFNAGE